MRFLLLVPVISFAMSVAGAFHCGEIGRDTGPGFLFSADYPEPLKNYHGLVDLYQKWHDGLFGSRRYYEKKLTRFLNNLVGKEIITDYDYVLVSPEGVIDKEVRCALRYGRWLYIHGELELESVRKITGDNYALLRKWWRSGILVAVTGKIKKFRLDRDPYGDTVHLFLEKVEMLHASPAK